MRTETRSISGMREKNICLNFRLFRGFGTELSTIIAAIEEQSLIPQQELKDFFWDMFIADALLGNFDRHNGNWGILVDEKNQIAETAPVYDCGSCLYPQIAAEEMGAVLEKEEEIDRRIFVFPTSAIQENGKKLSYFEYISSLKNQDCNAALKRIYERIDMEKINRVVQETPFLEPVQRDFYQIMLKERKEKILDFSKERLSTENNLND